MERFLNPQEDLPNDPDAIDNIVDPEDKEARREYREQVAQEIVERYGSREGKGLRQTLEGLYPGESWKEIQDRAKQIGISFDEEGRVRFKRPGAGENVPGIFEREDVLQSIVEGWVKANSFKEQWEVISYTYKYLNLVPPEMPEEEEVKEEGGFKSWLSKHANHAKVAALLALALLPNVHGKNNLEAAETGSVGGGTKIESQQEGGQKSAPYEIVSENLHALQKDENLTWPLAVRLLWDAGVKAPDETELNKVAAALAKSNNVAVPEWGVEGEYEHDKLPIGFEVDLREGRAAAERIASAS